MLELKLISRVIEDKSLAKVKQAGIKPEHFEPDARILWQFILSHYDKYSCVPSKQILIEKFSEELELPVVTDPISVWIDELIERERSRELIAFTSDFEKTFKDHGPKKALEIFDAFSLKQKGAFSSVQISTLGELTHSIREKYRQAEARETGIPTPWPTMTEWTMGWWPKDVSWISARLGVGKTFAAVKCAEAAVREGIKTLIISCELSKEDMGQRYVTFWGKFHYKKTRRGLLDENERSRFFMMLDELESEENLKIIDGQFGFKSEDIEKAIDQSGAQFIVIDAAYLIRAKTKTNNRYDNMAEVANELKRYAMLYNKSILATIQLNRSSTTKKNYDDSDVALSDVVGWNATNMFAMKQDDDCKKQGIMEIYALKVREAERTSEPLRIRWDLESMNLIDMTDEGIKSSHHAPANQPPPHGDEHAPPEYFKKHAQKAFIGFNEDDMDNFDP